VVVVVKWLWSRFFLVGDDTLMTIMHIMDSTIFWIVTAPIKTGLPSSESANDPAGPSHSITKSTTHINHESGASTIFPTSPLFVSFFVTLLAQRIVLQQVTEQPGPDPVPRVLPLFEW
jgi:hypothetical protein